MNTVLFFLTLEYYSLGYYSLGRNMHTITFLLKLVKNVSDENIMVLNNLLHGED